MQTFILSGGTNISRAKHIAEMTSSSSELIHLTAEKTTLTIGQVRDLIQPLSISARLPRIIWIEEANLLTIPAQNALLKILEEPPANTSFYLTCQSKNSLLVTIRSRSRSITLDQDIDANDPQILTDLKLVMAMSAGDRLANITKRDRAESIIWLLSIEKGLKEKLRGQGITQASATTLAKIATSAQKAHIELLANCSVGLVTQRFYLTLPHTRSQS